MTQLTTNTSEDMNTDAAVDVAGNVHAVYERDGSIHYRGRTGTTWSSEELVAAGTNPAVGAGASGIPQVVFLSGGFAWYTTRGEEGWGTPVQLAGTSASRVDLAVDAGGVAHVAYLANTNTRGTARASSTPAVPTEAVSPGTTGGYPDPRNNALAVADADTAFIVYGTTMAVADGTAWTILPLLPAGSSHALDTTSNPALDVAYVNATGGIEYAVDDTGTGFGTPLVLSTTTTGRNPVVIAETDPFVAFEAVDSADYEVWLARTKNQPPVFDEIGDQWADEGLNLSLTLSATDPDGDTVTYDIGNQPDGATFNFSTGAFLLDAELRQGGRPRGDLPRDRRRPDGLRDDHDHRRRQPDAARLLHRDVLPGARHPATPAATTAARPSWRAPIGRSTSSPAPAASRRRHGRSRSR